MVVFLPFFVKISEKMNQLERVSKDKLTLQEQKGELKYEKQLMFLNMPMISCLNLILLHVDNE